jgi:tripartite-type tricarboxylate transporter receptor subunit TctC
MSTRRQALASLAVLGGAPLLARPVLAQEEPFPSRPLRMIIPFGPGGANDIVARILQPVLQQQLGRPVVVENRPGATGNIGLEATARAAPDGYTMALSNAGAIAVNPAVFPGLTWQPLRDFASVTLVVETPNIIVVHPSLPVRTIAEFLDHVRARPGALNYGSAGSASQNRLEMEVFAKGEGLQVVNVPYRGGAGPAMNDLIAGHLQIMFTTVPTAFGAVQSGRARALAVTTAQRFPGLPEVPTLRELGFPRYVSSSWQGLHVPAGTPQPVIQRLFEAFTATLKDEGIARRLLEAGAVPAPSESPAAFHAFLTSEVARWRGVVQDIGVTPD